MQNAIADVERSVAPSSKDAAKITVIVPVYGDYEATQACLDLLAAIVVYSLIMQRVTTMRLLQGIARGALGNSAYEGGIGTALAGVGFHFTIAFCFTVFYFFIFN